MNEIKVKRYRRKRDFFKVTAGTVAAYAMPSSLMADGNDINDHKVLVVVNFLAGNDSLNMFIPSSTKGYEQYASIRRKSLVVKNNDLTSTLSNSTALALSKGAGNPYYDGKNIEKSYIKGFYKHTHSNFDGNIATNAMMPELAHLINQGKGAIIYNVGNIIQKATKAQLRAGEVKIPTSYSSHLDGQNYIASGRCAQTTFATGWLGALADKWGNINNSDIYKLNINTSRYGSQKMLFGYKEGVLNFPTTGPSKLHVYKTEEEKESIDNTLAMQKRDLFKNLFNQTRKNALKEIKTTTLDWESVSGSNNPFIGVQNAYGEALFTKTSTSDLGVNKSVYTSYLQDFEAAAKLIAIGKQKGFKRQVITITLPGWDTHSNQAYLHARNLRGLSMGVGAFQKAIDHLGLSENVTLFSVAEFARTTSTNSSGTDHGWGGSHFVIGGAVKGGAYGEFPDLEIGGKDDISSRGRIIPTTSFSQYYATLLKWFGANTQDIEDILPEVNNFSQKDLGFMKV